MPRPSPRGPHILGHAHGPALRRLLLADPDTNIFLLSALQSWGVAVADGVRWLGLGDTDRLDAVTWIGRPDPDPGRSTPAGLAVPWGEPSACRAIGAVLAQHGPPRTVIGPRQASDALWQGLGDPSPRIWFDQRLYLCTQVRPGPHLQLRRARPHEVDLVADMSGRMVAEDLGRDPREDDADGHHRKVRARVLSGRTILGVQAGEVVFKLDEGSKTADGTQVGGTWVPPRWRGQGLAKAGMRAACAELLKGTPRITLHVNEANMPAVRAYEATGFLPTTAFRLATR